MTITPTQNVWFDDSITSAMGEVFDHACKSLQGFGSACTVHEMIAKRIINAAKNGERDPDRIFTSIKGIFGIEDISMPVVSEGRDPVPSANA